MLSAMSHRFNRRRLLLGAAAAGSSTLVSAENPIFPILDKFIEQYLSTMNAPGMTLALANANGIVRISSFGFADLEAKAPVSPDLLFEIGSITKSFVALTLLQLKDEGKLDLGRPILEYLPWLPIETNYGPVTTHHLLTHTSGLPNGLGLFLSDPSARHVQASKPGERFHYSNPGFTILGYLIEKLDRRPWTESVRERIFRPLGMTSSEGIIAGHNRARTCRSYVPLLDDVRRAGQHPLTPAGNLVSDNAAGSIVSTPGDMGRYLQMLLKRGQAANGRIVSADGFAAFSKPYIDAKELSPTAKYGYGIGVDTLDGHTILRHSGGTISFASALHADLDSGVGAFASLNLQLGYRPNPVTQFAVQLMRAQLEGKQLPKPPDLPDPFAIANAADYVGVYTSPDNRTIEVLTQDGGLAVKMDGAAIRRRSSGDDTFWAMRPDLRRFPFVFGRSGTKVVEVAHGNAWYANSNYTGQRSFPSEESLEPFTGHYRGESALIGSMRVARRKGRLWIGGDALVPIGKALFRTGPDSPDTVEFIHVVEGKARMMKYVGADLWRVEAP
jgi:CubicO group peptidase (beta-lactamase class C family)